MKAETKFTTEIIKSFNHLFELGYIKKIPDSIRPNTKGMCKRCAAILSKQLRFMPIKYYDLFGSVDDTSFSIEVKVHSGTGAFPFSKVSEVQTKSLIEAHEAGRQTYIFLSVNNEDFFAIPFMFFYHLRESSERKSVKIVDLEDFRMNRRKINLKLILDLRFLGKNVT
jgi:penicillin-binding protein-related factor A (putative recombinase)